MDRLVNTPPPVDAPGLEHPKDQALAWFVRLHSGDADGADRRAFAVWLAQSETHRREYALLDAVWDDLDGLADPRAILSPPGSVTVVPTRRRVLAGGLALGGLALGGATLAAGGALLLPSVTPDHVTPMGRRETIALEDGSGLELDADSAVDVDLSGDLRRLRLHRGRMAVAVAPDRARPFQMVSRMGQVQSLDGHFVASLRATHLDVAVLRGIVLAGTSTGTRRVEAGQKLRLSVEGEAALLAVGAGDTAWRRGALVFEDDPLADVVEDLNRYRPDHIMVWDASIAALRVGGVFDAARPEAALDAIVATLPVRRLDLGPRLTVLRAI